MIKRYSLFHLILPLALLCMPALLKANGDPHTGPIGGPMNAQPILPDSILEAIALGHCNPLIVAYPSCTDHNLRLGAFISWLFTGQLEPVLATWNTGEVAHSITVIPPGAWSWDASGTGCEMGHWDTEYDAPQPFFLGMIDLTGPQTICPGFDYQIDLVNPDNYPFENIEWTPGGSSDIPLTITEPGTYTVTMTDFWDCPFTDQIVVLPSPPVSPTMAGPQALCPEGDTGVVTVFPNFAHYLWENGDTLNPLTITAPGTYLVTVTNQYGCTNTKEITIQSGEVPPINIDFSAPAICPGQTDILTGPQGYVSYVWSNNDLGLTNIVTEPGTYDLTVTNIYGCTNSGSVTIDTLPTPIIAISSTPMCPGASSTLTATSGMPQYLWSNAQTTNPITVGLAGTYTVTVTGAAICTATSSVTVVQLPAPTTVIAQPAQLNCQTLQTIINGTASSSGPNFAVQWTTVGGNFVSGQNTLQPTVNAPGLYTLLITNTQTGCTSTASVTVTSNMQAPPAPPGNPATLTCVVTNLNIGPVPFPPDTTLLPTWVASGGGNIVSGQNSWNPNINQPGTYILTVTNPLNHCTATGTVVIPQNIAPPASVIAQPSQLTCTMNTVALNGTGSSTGPNFTYLWTTPDGTIAGPTNTLNTTAASVGTYILQVTNTINGCTSTASVTVTADVNIPIIFVLPAATLTCDVLNITIDASASSSGPTFNYTWTGPNAGSIIAGQGTLQPTVIDPGTYTLQLVNNANSCSATLSVVVPQDIVPPLASAGPNSTLNCVIPTLVLDGSGSSTGPNFTYQWSTTDGVIVNGANGLTPTVSMAGTYNLLITNLTNGCTSTASTQVMNDANAPIALIANPATLTCTTIQTIINGMASTQGPTYSYNWTGPTPGSILSGQGTLQPTINAPGVYTLDIVNSANGCTDTETITVTQDILAPVALAGVDGLINCFTPAGTVGDPSNPSGAGFTLVWTTVGGHFTSGTNGPTANIDGAGTYQLLITNTTNGCTDTDVVVVVDDFVPPSIDAGPTFELTCTATTTILQGTGSTGANFTYQWSTTDGNIVSGGTTLNPTINADGTYNLLISNTTNGCTSTDQVLITQSAGVPTSVVAPANTLTCTLTSLNLNANGSSVSPTITYSWTASNGGNITANGTTLTPTIDAPGVYTLQVFDSANSCSSVATVIVPENIVNPDINAGTDNTLTCVITNLPLQGIVVSSSSPNLLYNWSTTNGTILGGANTLTPNIGSTGIYTLVVTDQINGCTDTDNVEIFANVVPPVASIATPQTLTCTLLQTPIDATASSPAPGFTYAWTTPNGTIVSGADSNQPIVSDPGTYNLLITNTQNGCTETASIVVPEDVTLPTAAPGPSVGLDCDTQTNALNGNGSSQGAIYSYLWTTTNGQIISGATTLTPQIGDPGTYVLTVNNLQNGCVSSNSVVVTEDVNPPVFTISNPQLLTCLTLTTPVIGTGNGFGNAPTYTWATTNGNILSGGNTLTASVDAPGIYTLTIVNTQNGCTDVEQVQVLQDITAPPLNTQPVAPLTCSILERTLQANAPAQALLQWTTVDGNIVSGANSPNPVVDEPGIYVVTATLPLNGCSSVAQTPVLREQNIPTGLQFSLDPPLCNGTLGFLTVDQINGGIGPFEYSIDGGATYFPAQDIDGLQPGTYDLVIQDINGCTVTQQVPVPAPPTPAVDLPSSFSIVLGDDQELQAIVPPAFPLPLIDQVIWEPTTGLTFEGNSIQQLLNPTAMPFVTTEYKVTILTKEGCKADSRTIIRVDRDIDIYAPNIIWPEDPDSDNSAFTLFTRPGSVKQILSLQIYDRWGEQMYVNQNFLADDRSLGWTGDFKGEPVNPGVFVWWAEVELIDGQTVLLKGDVTVVR